jgi:hypothetical protein
MLVMEARHSLLFAIGISEWILFLCKKEEFREK